MRDVLQPQEMTAAERRDATTRSDAQTLAPLVHNRKRTGLCMTWPNPRLFNVLSRNRTARKQSGSSRVVGLVWRDCSSSRCIKALQIYDHDFRRHKDGAATDDGDERSREGRRLGAELSSVGSISPVQGAMVSAELAGVVSKVGLRMAATAKKGDSAGPTRCLGRGSATAFRGSRFGTGAGRLGTRTRSRHAQGDFESGARRGGIEVQAESARSTTCAR